MLDYFLSHLFRCRSISIFPLYKVLFYFHSIVMYIQQREKSKKKINFEKIQQRKIILKSVTVSLLSIII